MGMIVFHSFAAFLLLVVLISAIYKEVRRSLRRRRYSHVPPVYRHFKLGESELMELMVLLNGQSADVTSVDPPPTYDDCVKKEQIS